MGGGKYEYGRSVIDVTIGMYLEMLPSHLLPPTREMQFTPFRRALAGHGELENDEQIIR